MTTKPFIIGTAGHIDHGKTALVKALTGTDTDRLKEEKERGITTDLGFAHMELPGGGRIGIVDVPGHEKFVRTMVAGATGIEAALIVIAADDGVKPQTREHVEICELLGISRAVVAITKSDLVDDDIMEVVKEDVRDFLKATPYATSAMIHVSTKTMKNIDILKNEIFKIYEEISARPGDGPFFFCVDRSFVKQGFGTVVTGVVISGTVKTGDRVEILPGGMIGKVRGLQVHGLEAGSAPAGGRAAVNVAGVDKAEIKRGAVLAEPGVYR